MLEDRRQPDPADAFAAEAAAMLRASARMDRMQGRAMAGALAGESQR